MSFFLTNVTCKTKNFWINMSGKMEQEAVRARIPNFILVDDHVFLMLPGEL